MTTALATTSTDYQGLTMVVSPRESLARMHELQALVKEVMRPGIDYGQIPGTKGNTLYQPGAQVLAEVYGFSVTFEDVETIQDWRSSPPFFHYRKRCILRARSDGRFIGDGVGSCNSRESRYGTRWVWESEIPEGVSRGTLKSKLVTGRNGASYKKYALENEDICSLVNTIEKMACKRALVHAVIGATRSAGAFTQDLEDLPPEAFGAASDARSWEEDAPAERPVAPALAVAKASAPVPAEEKPAPRRRASQPEPAPAAPAPEAAPSQEELRREPPPVHRPAAPPPVQDPPAAAAAPAAAPAVPVTDPGEIARLETEIRGATTLAEFDPFKARIMAVKDAAERARLTRLWNERRTAVRGAAKP